MTVFFSIPMKLRPYSQRDKKQNSDNININAFRSLLCSCAIADMGGDININEQVTQRIDERVEQLVNGNITALNELYQARLNKWIERIEGRDKVEYYKHAQQTKAKHEKVKKQLANLEAKIQAGSSPVWEFQRLALGVFSECTEQNKKEKIVKTLLTSPRQKFEEVAGSLLPLFQADIDRMLLNLGEKCRLDELKQFIDKVSKNSESCNESNGIELKDVLSWKP